MTSYQFNQPWLSKLTGDQEAAAREFANLRRYLQGLDNGTIPLFNLNALNATIGNLTITGTFPYLPLAGGTMTGAIAMGSHKITGLTAASASGDALSWGQAFTSGAITFSPTTTGIIGTTTNDNAASGVVGEYIESVGGPTNSPATSTYGDLTSISLTAGDWDTTAMCVWGRSGATWSDVRMGISTTSGNSAAGLVSGSNYAEDENSLGVTPNTISLTIASYRMSLASTTTVYLKYLSIYTAGGPPRGEFRLSARRIR